MDFMTIGGLAGGALVLMWGIREGATLSAFINLHGVLLVLGGTFCATMVNCSAWEFLGALRAGFGLFFTPRYKPPEETIPVLVDLCRTARRDGVRAVQDAGEARGDAFLSRCLEAAVTLSDKALALEALERDINRMRARHMEVANVFRVMGLLAPMFGLLGTLIGIITVLRNLSDAAQAGPGMAVAISSAFYGILAANLVCVPIANKLRTRSIAEGQSREVVMVGVLEIVFSQRAPLALESQLSGFLSGRRAEAEAGAPAAARSEV